MRVGVVLEALETSLRSGGNGRIGRFRSASLGYADRISQAEMDPAAVRLDLRLCPTK